MSFFAFIAFLIQSSQVPWVDMAERHIARVAMEQQLAAQRVAITARFTRSKSFALADVDEDVDPIAFADRLAAMRAEGEGETAALVEELQRQAEAEGAWAEKLANANATTNLDPEQEPPAPTTPSAPKPIPPRPPMQRPAPLPTKVTTTPAKNPVTTTAKGYTLSISKLGINEAPIIETDILDQKRFLSDLKGGVAHDFCNPGEPCKSVIFGHSSGFARDISAYKRIFARLNEMEVGDTVDVTRDGKRYTYKVFKKEIVGPNAVQILRNYNYEELTLFTCWPINTWKQRLVVYTKRI